MAILMLLLGIAYAVFYRFSDNSLALRRSAEDITKALRAGERWRADLRAATGVVRLENDANGSVLVVPGAGGEVAYQSTTNTVLRRVGSGNWTPLLESVKSSVMIADQQSKVSAWRWELELQPRSRKPARVRPLFTFIAVPERRTLP